MLIIIHLTTNNYDIRKSFNLFVIQVFTRTFIRKSVK